MQKSSRGSANAPSVSANATGAAIRRLPMRRVFIIELKLVPMSWADRRFFPAISGARLLAETTRPGST